MRFISILAASAIALSVPASAADFSFAYTFNTGEKITGTFTGDRSGDKVTNVSGITMALNGVAFNGPLYARGTSSNLGDGNNCGPASCYSAARTVVSFDPMKNNFLFADYATDASFPGTNYFYIFPWASAPTGIGLQAVFNNTFYNQVNHYYIPGNWSLTELSGGVPEPAQWALMLGGFGLAGTVMRRRRTRVSAVVFA